MASLLPAYVAAAKPVPQANRISWFKSTAQTYAGIMLWFVFWQDIPVGASLRGDIGQYSKFAGGMLSNGLVVAFAALILAALICHFLFYVVPGMLGMKTGLPLYIVGTSTYGVLGGFLMPGFLMGVLQFGWLAVNAFFSALLLCAPFGQGPGSAVHTIVTIVWAVAAGFMGLKGIQYVAKVATFLPVIPLAILLILFVSTVGGVGKFDAKALTEAGAKVSVQKTDAEITKEAKDKGIKAEEVNKEKESLKAEPALPAWKVIAVLGAYIVGFFATAGAAGADFGMNNRDAKDVQMGGLVGIAGATIFAGGLALLIVAGAYGGGQASGNVLRATGLMDGIVGEKTAAVFMYLLAIAAFPPACFSTFIAANSFKTTLPDVNPFVSCGIGTLAAIALAVSGWAGDAAGVFTIIGASFGPICGAMAADYLLAGCKWAGPRAGFNPAGWISWAVGFVVGAWDPIMAKLEPTLVDKVPCPPVAAFIVGFVLYAVLAKAGLESKSLDMPQAANR
ncbi:MAG: hypothetical protein ACYC35_02545 [Pirellulales bacterium]